MNGYIIVGIIFLIVAIVFIIRDIRRPNVPEPDSLPGPLEGEPPLNLMMVTMPSEIPESDMSERQKYLFSCYLAGNDAFDPLAKPHCPYPNRSPEAEQWVAGWILAQYGMMVDGREERRAAAADNKIQETQEGKTA